jgi:spermidine synthase
LKFQNIIPHTLSGAKFDSSAVPSPVLTITTTGFAATVAQIIVLRELLVLFYGNELSAGLIFAGWLLWSGLGSSLSGRWALKVSAHTALLRLMLVCLAAMLPLSVLFIRATRIIWMLPAGELPSIGKMLLISVVATGLFCPLSGALFGICWAIRRKRGDHQPLRIYLGEALGSAAGGLVFCFVFLPYGSVFTTIWITCGMILLISGWMCRPWRPLSKLGCGHGVWIAVALLVAAGAVCGSRLDHVSRRWQWGPNLLAVYDTAYHNIALLRKENQVSVFTNGLWLFSQPDRLSAEHMAHLPLLQHPHPKAILVLGGGMAGLLEELLKQPGIRNIDYVEPDPDFIGLVKPHLSPDMDASLQHPRIRLFHQDPRIFMGRAHARYDVILMNVGDPITAQMNRFYTKEFFTHVRRRLLPGGIFSFAVSGGESMLGPTQARFLGSMKKTLLQVFPRTLIYPGDQIRFFATDISGELLSDPASLATRISQRNLQLTYIREDILQNTLSPFRLDYLNAVLKETAGAAVNKDFFPICYFHNLMMWATQWHVALQKVLSLLVDLDLGWLWSVLVLGGGAIVALFWTGQCKYRMAVGGAIFVSGAMEMVLQVILLLSFQIIEGFVYRQLALIIAFFMAGLAAGAGWISRCKPHLLKTKVARTRFIQVQVMLCVLPLGLMLFLTLIHGQIHNYFSPPAIGWLFSVLSLMIGTVGGVHFALAVMVMAGTGIALEKIGGGFYALDLAGAAAGVLMATLLILPIYGIMNTLMFMSAISGVSLLTLLRRH